MKKGLLIILLAIMLSACAPEPTPEPTLIPTPTASELFKSQGLKFIEEATKLKSMTSQGVKFINYSEQLSQVSGTYVLLKSLWGDEFMSDTKENIELAIEGWECARLLWDLKIDYRYAVCNCDKTSEYFYKIYNYAGENLVINTRKDTFVDEVTGEELHKKTMPYDENISMLLSLASEYFEKAQPALLQIIQ